MNEYLFFYYDDKSLAFIIERSLLQGSTESGVVVYSSLKFFPIGKEVDSIWISYLQFSGSKTDNMRIECESFEKLFEEHVELFL